MRKIVLAALFALLPMLALAQGGPAPSTRIIPGVTPVIGGTSGSLLTSGGTVGQETPAALLASPPAIGSTTPGAVNATTLSATQGATLTGGGTFGGNWGGNFTDTTTGLPFFAPGYYSGTNEPNWYPTTSTNLLNGPLNIIQPYTWGAANNAVGQWITIGAPVSGANALAPVSGGAVTSGSANYITDIPSAVATGALAVRIAPLNGTGGSAGTFTATTFTPTSPISATITTELRKGMLIGTSDSPAYIGMIQSWTTNGSSQATSITVDEWCQHKSGGTCGIPAGTTAYINPPSGEWAYNFACKNNTSFQLNGVPSQCLGEVDVYNNAGSFTAGANGNVALDVPMGVPFWAGGIGSNANSAVVGDAVSSNFNYVLYCGQANISCSESHVSDSTMLWQNQSVTTGALQFQLYGNGSMDLGDQGATSAPIIRLHNIGLTQSDVTITGSGGVNGTANDGNVTVQAARVYFETPSGSKLAILGNAIQANGTTSLVLGDTTNGNSVQIADPGAAITNSISLGGGTASAAPFISAQNNADIRVLTPLADAAVVNLTSGSSYTVAAGVDVVRLNGVTSPFTLTLPASTAGILGNGRKILIDCPISVASLTVSANTGQSIGSGAPTACGPGAGHLLYYYSPSLTWDVIY